MNAVRICHDYGDRPVLKDFSLALEPGAFEAVMGPSGCGKSTFLHIAAGLVAPKSGEMFVGGRDVAKMGDSEAAVFRRRHVGVVFQAFNLLNGKTVRDNILLPLVLDGADVKTDEVRSRYAELAATLGLEGLDEKRPDAISGGERQRVAIARALMARPEVVLADEPTGNLDAAAAKAVCAVMERLKETERSAVLVVTHDPQVAARASKVHFLRDGAIAASAETLGDPARVSSLYLETYR